MFSKHTYIDAAEMTGWRVRSLARPERKKDMEKRRRRKKTSQVALARARKAASSFSSKNTRQAFFSTWGETGRKRVSSEATGYSLVSRGRGQPPPFPPDRRSPFPRAPESYARGRRSLSVSSHTSTRPSSRRLAGHFWPVHTRERERERERISRAGSSPGETRAALAFEGTRAHRPRVFLARGYVALSRSENARARILGRRVVRTVRDCGGCGDL